MAVVIDETSIPADYWDCEQWVIWHKALKKAYGLDEANDIFLTGWNKQGFWDSEIWWCRTKRDFVGYFEGQGINMAGTTATLVGAVGETVKGVATGVGKVIRLPFKLAPILVITVVGVAVYLLIKTARATRGEEVKQAALLAATKGRAK